MEITEAWILKKEATSLEKGEIRLPEIQELDVLVEPLVGSWEANMTHAIEGKPINIIKARGEEQGILGNAGVVRVLKIGSAVKNIQPGDAALFYPGSHLDPYGYPKLIHAYDSPGTMGLFIPMLFPACDIWNRQPDQKSL